MYCLFQIHISAFASRTGKKTETKFDKCLDNKFRKKSMYRNSEHETSTDQYQSKNEKSW